jgi:putative ATPase
MKNLGYGAGYAYDHDAEDGFSGQNYFPDGMARQQFYRPKGEGSEARVKERLERWAELRAKKGS